MKLSLYKPREAMAATRTMALRKKLIDEIGGYERQIGSLKHQGTYVNFTMMQTYKELIAARKEMLLQLNQVF